MENPILSRTLQPATATFPAAPRAVVIGMLLTTVWPAWGAEGDQESTGRQLLATLAPALVRVTATVKEQSAASGVQRQARESSAEGIGTVIDPTGIVVVPSSDFARHMPAAVVRVDGKPIPFQTTTEISNPIIHLADGTEVPARLAVEDTDLGLLYVVPTKADERRFASVSLPDGTAGAISAVQPLDEVFTLSRLGAVLGYEPLVRLTRITALPTRPRRGYTVAPKAEDEGAVFDLTVHRAFPWVGGVPAMSPAALCGPPALRSLHVRRASASMPALASTARRHGRNTPFLAPDPQTSRKDRLDRAIRRRAVDSHLASGRRRGGGTGAHPRRRHP
jgi:hypothetical protein